MTTQTTERKPKPKRETWRDWLPPGDPDPDELLTRDELLECLRVEGIAVTNDDLRNWQSAGIIPYGIRHWHKGATRVLYPSWMREVILLLRQLQATNHKMGKIRETLRNTFYRTFGKPVVVHVTPGNLSLDGATAHTIVTPTAAAVAVALPPSVEKRVEIPAELKNHIAAFARLSEQTLGGHIVRAQVRLIDDRGLPLVFNVDTHPTPKGSKFLPVRCAILK